MGVIEEPVLLKRHRLTVDEYHRMADAGVLAPDACVELIEGEIIDMAPMKSRHAAAINHLLEMLGAARGRAIATCQTPLRLSERSEPEPDLMLLRPRADRYCNALPTPSDVRLLIEVSETSLAYDRGIKLPLYARHGIGEVWIVDLENDLVRFFRRPIGDSYADITATETPGPTPLVALPELRLDLTGLL
jgi:Uma2 family endonuclease